VLALAALALALGACSTGSLDKILTSSERNATPAPASEGPPAAVVAAANNDTPCPDVKVRTGAATLMVGSKAGGTGEPSPLDIRYQGSIINTARECHLNAGILTIKVGVEGRVITGPAGGPGTVNVPLRIAVVHEGIDPKTVVSKFASIPVTIGNAVDRVSFTHVDPDVSFPMPRPASTIGSYVVYVGFDPQGEAPKKKPVRKRRR
jgi:hypothetical protein